MKLMSQSLVNEGRFPQGKEFFLHYDDEKESQSLVNEGRFPLDYGGDSWAGCSIFIVAIPR